MTASERERLTPEFLESIRRMAEDRLAAYESLEGEDRRLAMCRIAPDVLLALVAAGNALHAVLAVRLDTTPGLDDARVAHRARIAMRTIAEEALRGV